MKEYVPIRLEIVCIAQDIVTLSGVQLPEDELDFTS